MSHQIKITKQILTTTNHPQISTVTNLTLTLTPIPSPTHNPPPHVHKSNTSKKTASEKLLKTCLSDCRTSCKNTYIYM